MSINVTGKIPPHFWLGFTLVYMYTCICYAQSIDQNNLRILLCKPWIRASCSQAPDCPSTHPCTTSLLTHYFLCARVHWSMVTHHEAFKKWTKTFLSTKKVRSKVLNTLSLIKVGHVHIAQFSIALYTAFPRIGVTLEFNSPQIVLTSLTKRSKIAVALK